MDVVHDPGAPLNAMPCLVIVVMKAYMNAPLLHMLFTCKIGKHQATLLLNQVLTHLLCLIHAHRNSCNDATCHGFMPLHEPS